MQKRKGDDTKDQNEWEGWNTKDQNEWEGWTDCRRDMVLVPSRRSLATARIPSPPRLTPSGLNAVRMVSPPRIIPSGLNAVRMVSPPKRIDLSGFNVVSLPPLPGFRTEGPEAFKQQTPTMWSIQTLPRPVPVQSHAAGKRRAVPPDDALVESGRYVETVSGPIPIYISASGKNRAQPDKQPDNDDFDADMRAAIAASLLQLQEGDPGPASGDPGPASVDIDDDIEIQECYPGPVSVDLDDDMQAAIAASLMQLQEAEAGVASSDPWAASASFAAAPAFSTRRRKPPTAPSVPAAIVKPSASAANVEISNPGAIVKPSAPAANVEISAPAANVKPSASGAIVEISDEDDDAVERVYTMAGLQKLLIRIDVDKSVTVSEQMRAAFAAHEPYFKQLYQRVIKAPEDLFGCFARGKKDVGTLAPQTWLSDEIIDRFCNVILSDEQSLVAPTELKIFLVGATRGKVFYDTTNQARAHEEFDRFYSRAFLTKDREEHNLVMSVNLPGHWIVVSVNHKTKLIDVLNSTGSTEGHRAFVQQTKDLILHAHAAHYGKQQGAVAFQLDDWHDGALYTILPKQSNGYDCGVFSCLSIAGLIQMARAEHRGESVDPRHFFSFTQKEMSRFRRFILHRIIEHAEQ